MANPVMMPRQGQSVETCILGQWYKSVGDQVHEGDLLFSYETDKASFEEEAKSEGILLAIFFEAGDEVPVLTNVAVIGQSGESADAFAPGAVVSENSLAADNRNAIAGSGSDSLISGKAGADSASSKSASDGLGASAEPASLPGASIENGAFVASGERIRISPLARNMAEKMGVSVDVLKGTGPRGRIIARDVEAVLKTVEKAPETARIASAAVTPAAKAPAPVLPEGDYEDRPIPNIRKLIANAMHQSLQNSAQLTHHLSADARQLLNGRKKYKKAFAQGEIAQNITINDMVCFAVIRALEKFPQVNTHYMKDKMRWFGKVHLGLAVDTERGLMVPALKNASDLSLAGLSSQMQQLASQARNGNINPDLLHPEAATFTVSNLGNYGVEIFTPVINLPQTAILGVCAIVLRPKALEEGVYGFVPMIGLSLTYDHRALDGGEATRFLSEVKNQIEGLSF